MNIHIWRHIMRKLHVLSQTHIHVDTHKRVKNHFDAVKKSSICGFYGTIKERSTEPTHATQELVHKKLF